MCRFQFCAPCSEGCWGLRSGSESRLVRPSPWSSSNTALSYLCLPSQMSEHECLISLERLLSHCWVGIGWGLSLLSNNEKPEHSGICCWPNWHKVLLSELFFIDGKSKSEKLFSCLVWADSSVITVPRETRSRTGCQDCSAGQPLQTGVVENVGQTSWENFLWCSAHCQDLALQEWLPPHLCTWGHAASGVWGICNFKM